MNCGPAKPTAHQVDAGKVIADTTLNGGNALNFGFTDSFSAATGLKYTGLATASDGGFNASYTLIDASLMDHLTRDFSSTFGVDNLLNSHGEAVVGYPLPSRIFFASLELEF